MTTRTAQASQRTWAWPIDITHYDQSPELSGAELAAVTKLAHADQGRLWARQWHTLGCARLTDPIQDVLTLLRYPPAQHSKVVLFLLRAMYHQQQSFWAWTEQDWRMLFATAHRAPVEHRMRGDVASARMAAMSVSYILCNITDPTVFCSPYLAQLAARVFPPPLVAAAVEQVRQELLGWGYRATYRSACATMVCVLLLRNRSPYLAQLPAAVVTQQAAVNQSRTQTIALQRVSQALVGLGILPAPVPPTHVNNVPRGIPDLAHGMAPAWFAWTQRWYRTATTAPTARAEVYYRVLKAGRWLAATHPHITSPDQWTRELAVEYVAAVDRMRVGEWVIHHPRLPHRVGQPLRPRAKAGELAAVRTFFRDCQEWGWLPRRFDPARCFAVPRAIRATIGPEPRVIADDIWAKLVWAGLNLQPADLPACGAPSGTRDGERRVWGTWYPFELVRAFVLVWLFGGLRRNELWRLRVGCVRWQAAASEPGAAPAPHAPVCLLDVPVSKTATAFTKPVDRIIGEAITAWEQVRPSQPPLLDAKTGQMVQYLFAYRGRQISYRYINRVIIPFLCRKAGVPEQDARGPITSHRARSTIATQLFNAKEPLSLFELQAWLGHRSPTATQHYAQVTPTKLAQAYTSAGYFERNVRTIEVLLDQDVIKSGAAAHGEPWRFYDLGHGYCTYDFFDQCPHRMACAKCAFYRPKGSIQAQLLEGKANLQRMLQAIPLTDDERRAVEDGIGALEQLATTLTDVPTPAGPTPRQLATWAEGSIVLTPNSGSEGAEDA